MPTLEQYLLYGGLILAALLTFGIIKARRSDSLKTVAYIAAGIGLASVLGLVSLQSLSSSMGLTDSTPTPGGGSETAPGSSLAGAPVGNVVVAVAEKGSNSYSVVDAIARFYNAGDNPKDANVNPIVDIQVNNGASAAYTGGLLKKDTQYRVVIVNSSTVGWYTVDLGVTTPITSSNYQPEADKATIIIDGAKSAARVATLDDMLAETTSGNANIAGGNFSGTTECNESQSWVGNATDVLYYDESAGSASGEYFDPLISVSGGANRYLKDPVVQFQWDATNPPGGQEVTACQFSLVSGSDPALPSDCLGAWKNQARVKMNGGADMSAGFLGRIRTTYSFDEAAWDADERWNFCFADLGGRNDQDVGLSSGAADDCISIRRCA